MTNICETTKTTKRSFSLNWMPQIRIAIPSLVRRSPVERKVQSAEKIARDDLMELFQSDLSGMKSLKSVKRRQNVIQLRPARAAAPSGLGHAA